MKDIIDRLVKERDLTDEEFEQLILCEDKQTTE